MRKGQGNSSFDRCPIYFNPVMFQEEWRNIHDFIPEIRDYYFISNLGRIFHKYHNKILTTNIDARGYCYKPLATINGNKNYRVHRLVMTCFMYFQGCESFEVNHKDGIKTNNTIFNLEWVTKQQNVKHAFDTGLNQSRRVNDETVHAICKLLEDPDMKLTEIAKRVGTHLQNVNAIQQRRTHTDISSQYNIQPRKINNNFSMEQVEKLCQYFQDHRFDDMAYNIDFYCLTAIREATGIEDPDYKFIRSAKNILLKNSYQYVSCKYDF